MKRRNFVKTLGASAVGLTAAAATAPTATATFHNGTGIRTIASSLNVRDAPWGNVIDSVSRGTTATVQSGPTISDGRWYELDFGSYTGWCEASYLIPDYAWWHSGVHEAVQHTGTPYEWGGNDPSGFDCSGLIWYAYREAGVVPNSFPDGTWNQQQWAHDNAHVFYDLGDALSGDILFWEGDINHVAIHLGHIKVFHAPSSGRVCQTDHRDSVRSGAYPDEIWRLDA